MTVKRRVKQNMTLLNLLILALAAWRLAYMLVQESGPGHVLATLRKRLGVIEVEVQTPTGMHKERNATNWVGTLFTCVNCMSVWTAALCYGLLLTPLAPVVYVLAGSGLALWGHSYTGWRYKQ